MCAPTIFLVSNVGGEEMMPIETEESNLRKISSGPLELLRV